MRDLHLENFSVSNGGQELIQDANITMAFGRRYVGRAFGSYCALYCVGAGALHVVVTLHCVGPLHCLWHRLRDAGAKVRLCCFCIDGPEWA